MAEITREERVNELAALYENAKAKATAYNEAVQNGKADVFMKLDEEIGDLVNKYTAAARDLCFEDCKATGDPMMAAVRQLNFDTIAIKDEKKDEDRVHVRTIEPKKCAIDLLKLDAYCGGIGVDPAWRHMAQKFNCLLTMRTCKELGIDPKTVNDSYAMSAIAAEMDLGKTPTSNTQMLNTINKLIAAMVGDYKATSHEVSYLLMIYTKKGRNALSVACANHTKFVGYIAEIANKVIMHKEYDVEYKKRKGA